ncbi:hypothetical protein H257_19225 [Aphanomyces astaci]|uniref:DDE-1 domain-containing protein n=1 Tax=Aphanomyces astaci TaxID=112090 RepID=W4FAU4_APHAT|nr:hypothetical protein H257_19225 [Aphanomyces astaci]ETV63843.1 hypothetical protein H257_19225 [Aphanomyces astaci]|eukprot:XP_009846674.1 hypothetical protein H257_19225 [Aphanomyces astaci]
MPPHYIWPAAVVSQVQYLWFVLAERVTGKSVLVLDNIKSHDSDEVNETAALGYDRHMRDLWIAEDMVSDNSEDNDIDWMSPAADITQ